MVGATVGEPMDQPRVGVKGKDDWLILGKEAGVKYAIEVLRL